MYEHNGGEVDQKYLDDSGDTTVRLKQMIRETQEEAHSLVGVVKMARSRHEGFPALIRVDEDPVRAIQEEKKRMADWRADVR